jgi:hypothetical protein
MSAGKGDKPREVNKKQFDNNFDNIKWNKEEKKNPIKNKKGKITYVYK